MVNTIPYDDSPIVDEKALAKKHHDLVQKLKETLYAGNVGFIKAGQYLTEIKKSETYEYEDSTEKQSWGDFLQRPDIPLSGESREGRIRVAQKLMTVWFNIASQPDVDEKKLAKIGYTKLALIAGILSRDPNSKLSDWLDKAEVLSTTDLQLEIASGGKTISETNDCDCSDIEEVDAFRCKDCKKFFKKDPRLKKQDEE